MPCMQVLNVYKCGAAMTNYVMVLNRFNQEQ